MNKRKIENFRERLADIIDVRVGGDAAGHAFDLFYLITIVINLTASIMLTYDHLQLQYGVLLLRIEQATVVVFSIDYFLRLWTAKYMYREVSSRRAVWKYMVSFSGIVDLLSFFPYFLPFFFPSGAVAFRSLRIMRVFNLFRINAYYDSLKLITEVLVSKKQQLISSVFTVLILMVASSLCMYSLEHEAQPEVFSNAFSGIWWASSTLLTVGYGDIYPITTLGKLFGILITFLGVGMVAIPTGIISAGFVDHYSRIKRMSDYGQESDIHFIKIHLVDRDPWVNHSIAEIRLPERVIVAAVKRKDHVFVPRGNMILRADDVMVLGAESFDDKEHIKLKEITLQKNHPWIGHPIHELDISRHSIIVLVKRKKRILIPRGNMVLKEQDILIMYTQTFIANANDIEV